MPLFVWFNMWERLFLVYLWKSFQIFLHFIFAIISLLFLDILGKDRFLNFFCHLTCGAFTF